VGSGAIVRKAILDKEVVVEPGATVGVDHADDRRRGFTVSEGGVTVVAKGTVISQ
jgi:glucose-1-phosphate adenylyltransferase